MSHKKQKLELTWIGKENRPLLEPRILLEDPEKTYHAGHSVTGHDLFDNKLIFGDNLLALKALESEYSGKVKCVFIDPPYNTGSAFEHYDDGLEHSIWLSLMRDRLEIIRRLLSDDGSLWITIDDTEAHYLKVVCDEIFGRVNFIADAVWEKADSPRMDAQFFSSRHDHLLVYAKVIARTVWNRLSTGEAPGHYDKIDNQGRRYYLKPLRAMGGQGDSRSARPTLYFPLIAPDGSEIYPKRQDGTDGAWRWKQAKVAEEAERIDWIKGRNGWTPYYRIFAEENHTRPPETIWPHGEVGSNRTSKREIKDLFPDLTPFGTPKPERLLHRVLSIASNPGDLILDSFAGSGTTGAVAHKMGRSWIMVELGEQCHSHIIPRLKKVIDGEDDGGITKILGWKGGGGFRYYRLAPSLLEKDKWGNWVINKEYNAAMLAEALCKLEGFTYAPSDSIYWQHGHSTERDYVYVTTANLLHSQLQQLSDEVGPDRSLLVLCTAFRAKTQVYSNLTVKKIPRQVLARCEWGHDDYSLRVENLPQMPERPGQPSLFGEEVEE
ncbi:MAG: site-specific DNA-methyltransferase [Leptonema illini]|uniref:site-specific DNA-methyltransferase (adenine-specific) n=1 Tax=Leptonema illini TaxID=183 RepID=A0A833LVJ8_9LEPT|nr:MAG: site-specific DNA-methyltransferase [Leptonema illini]